MNTYIPKIYLLIGLLACTACSNEEELQETISNGSEVTFGSTIQDNLLTRALGDNKADKVALPYIYEINVRMMDSEADKIYHVKSANKGTLEVGTSNILGSDPFTWDKSGKEVDFFAWTEPDGVTIDNTTSSVKEGTVDFTNQSNAGGNYYLASEHTGESHNVITKNSINGDSYTPLEVFISAHGTGNFATSPSAMLPFKHLVSKLSIVVRDWDYKDITTDKADKIAITFLSIHDKWKVAQTETGMKQPFHITESTSSDALILSFEKLKTEKVGNTNYVVCYLPPMDNTVGIDMANAGDFCITYDNNKYFGTLKDCLGTNKNSLAAGEHMRIVFDLTKNYGAGAGAWIDDWKFAKEEITYTDPRQGIYSLEGWKVLVDYLDDMTNLPDSLYTTDANGVKTISLYNNLSISDDLLLKKKFSGFIFDGLGHTITLPATATQGLFNLVGDGAAAAATTIQNLRIEGGTISGATGSLGLLIGEATNTNIVNCHIINGSVTNTGVDATTGVAGGLIGTASAGVTLTNCSVETSGTISGGTAGALVGTFGANTGAIGNSFAAFTGTVGGPSLVGSGTVTITDSYYWNTTATTSPGGKFWDNISTEKDITLDGNITKDDGAIISLLNALNDTGKGWVNVYGKDYPVLKIE